MSGDRSLKLGRPRRPDVTGARRRTRPSAPLGLLVLALHLGLGLGLHQVLQQPSPPPASAAPRHVWVTLPAPPAAIRQPVPGRAPLAPAVAMPARPARSSDIQAITPPAAAAPTPPPPADAAAQAPAAAAASAATPAPSPAPLNLALPARPASAPPAAAWARDDARVHDTPLDGEQRMARSLGTDTTLRSVRRGDGFELRRGNGCVQVQPSRTGQILPADSSTPRPALVGRC